MESNLAMVNMSDFSCSMLTLSIKFLEIISFLEFLVARWGHVVCVFAAVLGIESWSNFGLGGLLHFLFTLAVSYSLVL